MRILPATSFIYCRRADKFKWDSDSHRTARDYFTCDLKLKLSPADRKWVPPPPDENLTVSDRVASQVGQLYGHDAEYPQGTGRLANLHLTSARRVYSVA